MDYSLRDSPVKTLNPREYWLNARIRNRDDLYPADPLFNENDMTTRF